MTYHLTELTYNPDPEYPLLIYIFGPPGYYYVPMNLTLKTVEFALSRKPFAVADQTALNFYLNTAVAHAIHASMEVRITDTGDRIVFHAVDGKVVYPVVANLST